MVAPKLRRRGAWPGVTDATRNALADSEGNAADAVDQIARWAKPRWTYTAQNYAYQANPWDWVAARAAITVRLPEPTPQMVGVEIRVTNLSSGVVTVVPVSGTIDGYPTSLVTATRTYACGEGTWHWIHDEEDVWDDLIGPVDYAATVASLTQETYRDTPVLVSAFRHDQDDAITLRYQMRHGWDLGIVRPHLHFIPLAAANGTLALDGYYAWSHIGTLALPALSGWTAFSATKAIVTADQWIEQVVGYASCVPPAAAQYPSAQLWVYLRRPGLSSASDTYSTNKTGGTIQANILLSAADCHIRMTRDGTRNEWTNA